MHITPLGINKKQHGISKKSTVLTADDTLRQLAFDNSLHPNIISIAGSGKIIMVNRAACKLLHYSKKELLTKSRSDIFDIKDSRFKKMLKTRIREGKSEAMVTVLQKSGKAIPVQITSAVFTDWDGIKKAITTVEDMQQSIRRQKKIDTVKDKKVAADIALAKSTQTHIDAAKDKKVAGDIVLAKSTQKDIDIKKEKKVATDIALVKKVQKAIDVKKEKKVTDDITLAKSTQREIDSQKEKKIAADIAMAKTVQKAIDVKKEKKVSDDISLARSTQKKIDSKKEKKVAADIALVKTVQKAIDVKKEKKVAVNIAISKAKQKKLDISKAKEVAGNIILAQQKSDARLAENNEWIKYMVEASYDVMWNWNISTGEIHVGDSIAEVFGCRVQNNTVNFKDFSRALYPQEKDMVEQKIMRSLGSVDNTWNDAYLLKRNDNSLAATVSRASIIRDETGKALHLIGVTQDISRLQALEQQLMQQLSVKTENNEAFQLAAKLSYDGLWDWNIITDDFFLGDGFTGIFGFDIYKTTRSITDLFSHLHPDDKEAMEKGLQNALASSTRYWEHAYRFMKGDGSIAEVFGRTSIIRDAAGKACRLIGAVHDISKQKILEEKLVHEIKLKEKQIKEAIEDARDTERSDIGKELHDNINQLLGASRMYLEMAKRGAGNSELYLSRSSEYTLTAIEEIRKLTRGLTTDTIKNLGLCEAIGNITLHTMEIIPAKISCSMDNFKEDNVNDKFKLNIYRIVQEQLNNIIKHAGAMKVSITISQNKKTILLSIADDGVGFVTGDKHTGIGIDNIKSRTAHYNGTADFVSQPGHGCVLNILFPHSALTAK